MLKKHKLPHRLDKFLYNYQHEGIEFILQNCMNHNSTILADQMGLGKTVQSVATVIHYIFIKIKENEEFNNILLVCPINTISLFNDTINQVLKFYNKDFQNEIEIKYLRKISEVKEYENTLFLVSYDKMRNIINRNPKFVYTFEIAIFDECQKIKNEKSNLHKGLINISSYSKILISGTPIQNNISDLLSIISFGGGTRLTKYKYLKYMIEQSSLDSTLHYGLRSAISTKCMDDIRLYLKDTLIRRTWSEVYSITHSQLQVKIDDAVFMNMTPAHFNVYYGFLYLVNSFEHLFKSKQAVGVISQLNQISNYPRLKNDTIKNLVGDRFDGYSYFKNLIENQIQKYDISKFKFVMDIIQNFKTSKILIFCDYIATINNLCKFLTENEINHFSLTGSDDLKNREFQFKKFRFSQTCNVMILSKRMSHYGINLGYCDVCILINPSWNPQIDSQCIHRLKRVDSSAKDLRIFRLIYACTLEHFIYDVQRGKSKIASNLFDKKDYDIKKNKIRFVDFMNKTKTVSDFKSILDYYENKSYLYYNLDVATVKIEHKWDPSLKNINSVYNNLHQSFVSIKGVVSWKESLEVGEDQETDLLALSERKLGAIQKDYDEDMKSQIRTLYELTAQDDAQFLARKKMLQWNEKAGKFGIRTKVFLAWFRANFVSEQMPLFKLVLQDICYIEDQFWFIKDNDHK